MAIYHLHASVISRGKGRSAVAAAAYRRAEKLFDERQQRTWDYSNKPNVIHSELLVPHAAQTLAWVKNLFSLHESNHSQATEQLWNLVEASEKRIDAQLAREIEFALPLELDQTQCIQLAREFIHDQFVLRGMIADWAVHWDAGNPHVHVMLTMRAIIDSGFGQKVVVWNNKALLQEWRKQWANYANFHLRLHQVAVKIDHRSYQDQGIELIPTLHQGRRVLEMQAREINTDLVSEAKQIKKQNLQRIRTKPHILLDKITAQQDTFTLQTIAQELERYIPDNTDKAFVLNPDMIHQILKTLEHHESVFKETDLAKALLPFAQDTDEFVLALQAIKASDQLVYLGVGEDGRDRFTSRTMLELENQIQTIADALKTNYQTQHIYPTKLINRRIDTVLKAYQKQLGKSLTEEQLLAVKHIVKPQQIACVVGRAGTGKSFSLGAARAVWEASGLQVQGIALSGIAADGLTKDAGINSRTIESFRYSLAQGTITLSQRDVVVMDEAGMTDSVSLLAVLKAIQEAKAKLVLVGDPAQLQPVGPGATFRALLERIGFAELQTVYRQKTAWQREATIVFSSGQIPQGLKAYFDAGCIHFAENESDTQRELINDWQHLRELQNKSLSEYLIIAHRNRDVVALNRLARAERVQRKEVAPGLKVSTKLGDISVSKGDRLLFLKNDRQLGVSNGRFATILQVDFTESGHVRAITVELDGEVKPDQTKKTVTFDPGQYQNFTYGYAATVHKVQGMTVDHAFVLASGNGWNRPLTYVVQSRHRETCHLYADKTSHADFTQLTKNLNRLGLKDSLLDFPLAFSQRRGIEMPGLLEHLAPHLAKRLKQFRTNLTSRFEQIVYPERYWVSQQKKAKIAEAKQQALKITETLQRREDAKVVAAYVDANRYFGKAWEAYTAKITALGFKQIPYGQPAFEVLKTTAEYITLQTASVERDRLAAEIMVEPARYTTALEIYALSLEKLNHQNTNHQKREMVNQYLKANQQSKVVIRDRLAAHIYAEIKSYYSTLKTANTNTRELRQQAEQHARRKLFTTLNSKERQAFTVVEDYCQQVKAIGQLARQFTKPEDWQLTQSKILLRDALAYRIVSDTATYDKALDFYQIGSVNSPLRNSNEKPTQDVITQSQARWHRLQIQAAKQAIRERITNYQSALNEKNILKRHHLAHEMMGDVKSHYRAMMEAQLPRKTLYLDARAAERRELFEGASFDEKKLLRLATRYQKVNRQVGRTWATIFKFKTQKNKTFPATKQSQQKQQAAFTLTAKRDYLAHRLLELTQQMEWPAIFEGIAVPKAITILREQWKIDFNKLKSQSAKHEQRLKTAQDWQAMKSHSEETLCRLIQHSHQVNHQDNHHSKNQNNTATITHYYDWLAENEDVLTSLKPIIKRLNTYQYALQSVRISSKACTTYEASIAHLKHTLTQLHDLSEIHSQQAQQNQTLSARSLVWDKDQLQKIRKAQQIERGTRMITGTLAERYLREHRGIQGKLPSTYRYHPGVYHGEAKCRLPALIVIAKNSQKQTQAVQVIFLNPQTANKAKLNNAKLTYGVLSQNQVGVLVNRGCDQKTIAVAEGPETALSIYEANSSITIYATLGSSNFARVPHTSETKKILFCADNDGKESASQKKLLKAAEQLAQKGLEVWQVMPAQEKQDFNDVLKNQGVAEIQHQLEQSVLLKKAQSLQTAREEIQQAAAQLIDKTSHDGIQQENNDKNKKVLHQLLATYVDHELELTQLVTKMHETCFTSKTVSKDYAQQAHALEAKIKQLADEIIQHPVIKDEIQTLSTPSQPHGINIVKLGGFAIIKERLLNQGLTKQDITALIKHVNSKTQKTNRLFHQDRERGRRSY